MAALVVLLVGLGAVPGLIAQAPGAAPHAAGQAVETQAAETQAAVRATGTAADSAPNAVGGAVRLTPNLAAAGQPTPQALLKLKEMGFRTVVNLRTEAEGPAEEAQTVRAAGLRYVSVPFSAKSLSLAVVDAVEKVVKDEAATPVLLHCLSATSSESTSVALIISL